MISADWPCFRRCGPEGITCCKMIGKLRFPPEVLFRWNMWKEGCMDGKIFSTKWGNDFGVKREKFLEVGEGWSEKSWFYDGHRICILLCFFSCDDHHSTNEAAILRAENWLRCFGRWFLVYRSLSCIKCLATFSNYGRVATKWKKKNIRSKLWWTEISDSCSAYDFTWVLRHKIITDSTKINYENLSEWCDITWRYSPFSG